MPEKTTAFQNVLNISKVETVLITEKVLFNTNEVIEGTAGDDVFNATNTVGLYEGVTYFGLDGNDEINAYSATASDFLYGGNGDDEISGEGGDDDLYGGDGDDEIYGGTGEDYLEGGDGNDILQGGYSGASTIYGGIGDDTISGGQEADILIGGAGNDTLTFAPTNAGPNSSTEGVNVNLATNVVSGGHAEGDTISGFVNVTGTDYGDVLTGTSGANIINSDRGDDLVYAGSGDDLIDGDYGDDEINGDAGADLIGGGYGDDTIFGGTGNDRIGVSDFTIGFYGGSFGDDEIHGGDGDDIIEDSRGNNTIYGDAGNDTIEAGDEGTVYGGSGADTITADDDVIVYGGDGIDTIESESTVYGGFGDDIISTSFFGDAFVAFGDEGNDVITGGRNADTINGGDDQDTVTGGDGNDIVLGAADSDTLSGEDGDDLIFGEENGGYGTDESAQVFRLFNSVFDRAPGQDGHQFWMTQLLSGTLDLSEVAQQFITVPEFQATYGTTTNLEFVSLLFENILGRLPLEAGLNFWVGEIETGARSRAEVLKSISEALENRNLTAEALETFEESADATIFGPRIFRLFEALFDREPNQAGFEAWAEQFQNGLTFTEAVSSFMGTNEFQTVYAGTDNEGFVIKLYNNVLGRDPADAGLAAWVENLENGMTREAVVEFFVDSAEFVTSTNDQLFDFMSGFGVDDTINAGAGDNNVAGGLYADTFVFDVADEGTTNVLDWEEWDFLEFVDFGYVAAADATAQMSQNGNNVVFSDLGTVIVFEDTVLADILESQVLI